jgi:glycerophosphoryl diester phosphodiesterase
MLSRRTALTAAGAALAAGAHAASAQAQPRKKALIYGHRGASALRPEHTLASYAKAIADGADFIEPDLVSTKDGVLVARHEPDISETTDVAARPEFASRRRTLPFDGHNVTGWFTIDFTLDELKSLRCKERLGAAVRPESASYDGQFQIVTWEEMIDFAAAESAARGKLIGLVPELKSSTWHRANGHPIDERFLDVTARHSYAQKAPLHVQSFEIDNLKFLRAKLGRPSNLKLVQLVGASHEKPMDGRGLTYGQMTTPEGFAAIQRYAEVVAPNLRSVIPLNAKGGLGAPNRFVSDAHAAGLGVVVWTFRPENRFLPKDLRSDAGENARNPAGSLTEMRRFLDLGVDGFFTDDPALGRQAVDATAA